ncbi:Tn3 family transposase [Celerinatantimonas yamalensis]|uniref:Tn3 family transposase n=1 Tax=Celerinatantimonas yamalensis TaxID=559956 RepID=A0ABW9GAX6_9GAMM
MTQLNRSEGRYSVTRTICHGEHGEIRKRYREGPEVQLESLELGNKCYCLMRYTVYAASPWTFNTDSQPTETNEEDISRLSPLRCMAILIC